MKDGAIELSMGMVVMIILSLVILTMGIWFGNRVVGEGNKLTDDTFTKMEQNLNNILCNDNELVCLQPGRSKGKIGVGKQFTLRINNIGDTADFMIEVELINAYSGVNNGLFGASELTSAKSYIEGNWIHYTTSTFSIPSNTPKNKLIFIQPTSEMISGQSTVKGTYLFSVRVKRETPDSTFENYGSAQSITLEVY